ncbi:MAG TPA: hypothetical protein VLN58_10390, partial [Verrucomicrobiae bacterium]|nr:hypothetical protein [Verrucomicrobiae bacterium]
CFAASLQSKSQTSLTPRFEVGGGITGIRNIFVSDIGPTVEGDVNFGSHVALDAAFQWMPASFSQTVNGFFGAKVGIRTEHFGFFGKIRPGFISTSDTLRGSTINLDTGQASARFGRLTEKALDAGGVIEYYPAHHWLMRWDLGDTVLFEQPTVFTVTGINAPSSLSVSRGTTNHFQFSAAVHYRF